MESRPKTYSSIAPRAYFSAETLEAVEAFNTSLEMQAEALEDVRARSTNITGEITPDSGWRNTAMAPLSLTGTSLMAEVESIRAAALRWLDTELSLLARKEAVQTMGDADLAAGLAALDLAMAKAQEKALAALRKAGLEDVVRPHAPACDAIAKSKRDLAEANHGPLVEGNDRAHYGQVCAIVRNFVTPMLPVL